MNYCLEVLILSNKLFTYALSDIETPIISPSHPAVLENKDLVLKCSSSSSGNPKYQWSHNSKVLNNSNILRFDNVSVSQAGEYTCDVVLGGIRKRRTLEVEVECKFKPFVTGLSSGTSSQVPVKHNLMILRNAKKYSSNLILEYFSITALFLFLMSFYPRRQSIRIVKNT